MYYSIASALERSDKKWLKERCGRSGVDSCAICMVAIISVCMKALVSGSCGVFFGKFAISLAFRWEGGGLAASDGGGFSNPLGRQRIRSLTEHPPPPCSRTRRDVLENNGLFVVAGLMTIVLGGEQKRRVSPAVFFCLVVGWKSNGMNNQVLN